MDEVWDSLMEARTKAIEQFISAHDVTVEDIEASKYVLDISTLPNGDERITLYEKVQKGTTVIQYKVNITDKK